MFLTCDKLDAEASLRMSSHPALFRGDPGVALARRTPVSHWRIDAILLFARGVGRAFEGRDAAREAVIAGVVAHPLEDLVAAFPFGVTSGTADKDSDEAGV